ncbi:archaellin/type IV pilin N-terminal domain-containing protein [Natrinema sp. CBA1119]|uniref:archaellin/type IV pilin N-terminal domain-containing protein n=1 Tax=Natrinema sp. CBA1119 TaxID=1608465 RepID=UPI00159BE7BC|nr:archaellin/type IV pilin N-terminal domain-containing protein [Natrinema sp. CBA1119]
MKGISPIIAAVLLTGFTVSVAVVTAPFYTDTLESSQEGVEDRQDDLLDSTSARLDILDVVYNTQDGFLNLTIQNNGETELTNFSVTGFADSPVQEQFTEPLDTNEITTFTMATPGTGNVDRVEVASQQFSAMDVIDLKDLAAGTPPPTPEGITIN